MTTPAEKPSPAAVTSAAPETPAARAEAAATRRRWINLAEFVGVAGLLIAAAGLWLSYSDRRETANEKAAAAHEHALVTLTATRSGDQLALSDPDHRVQHVTVRFPRALGLAAQSSDVDPAIDPAWFADAILKATDGGPDAQRGVLPVLIESRYWDGDVARTDRAIYDIAWRTEGRMLRGRKLIATGIALRSRTSSSAALDAAWAASKPR